MNGLLYSAARQWILQFTSWIRLSRLHRPWLQGECRYFSECLSLSPPGVFRSGNILCSFTPYAFVSLKYKAFFLPHPLFFCVSSSLSSSVFLLLHREQEKKKKTDEKQDSKCKGGWNWLKESADWKRMWTFQKCKNNIKETNKKTAVLKPNEISIWQCKTGSVWSCSFLEAGLMDTDYTCVGLKRVFNWKSVIEQLIQSLALALAFRLLCSPQLSRSL